MLGERISLLRRRQGWSQAELAARIQVSPSAVGMYEQGRREPSLLVAVQLSRAFGVSADYLLTGTPLTESDDAAMHQAVARSVEQMRARRQAFSAEELAALYAAMMDA